MPKRADWTAHNRRILVVGPSGSGKSSWTEVYLRGQSAKRIWVFDQKGEMTRRYGIPSWSDPGLASRALLSSCAFNPHVAFATSSQEQAFAAWSWWCWRAATILPGRAVVVVDELQDFIRPGPRGVPAGLRALLQAGRGYGVDVVCLAQGSNEVAARLRGQFTEVVAFASHEPRAVEMLRAFGFDSDRIRQLPRLHFIHRSLANGAERCGRISFVQDGKAQVELAAP